VWLEVDSGIVALSRPGRAPGWCPIPPPPVKANQWALQTKKRKYENQDEIMAGNLVADFPLVLSKQARIY
jgi:hypothetical protein